MHLVRIVFVHMCYFFTTPSALRLTSGSLNKPLGVKGPVVSKFGQNIINACIDYFLAKF